MHLDPSAKQVLLALPTATWTAEFQALLYGRPGASRSSGQHIAAHT